MAVKSVIEVADADAAAATVLDIAQPGDVVLVKASHFMGLDRVVERVVS
jgi:UDP-N-acetylmuramyl pentapeptide synthase